MAPPHPDHPPHHPLGDTMHGLVVDVKEIKDGLLGCIETGETGLIARVAALEKKVEEALERRKFREQTIFAAAVGAVATAVAAIWVALTGRSP